MRVRNIPTIFVILGATGDLAAKKIVPVLFHLFAGGKLPKMFRAVGFARREMSHAAFRDYIGRILEEHSHTKDGADRMPDFLKLFFYEQGFFEDKKFYRKLSEFLAQTDYEWKVCKRVTC